MTPLFVNLTNHRVNQGTKEGCACNRVQARMLLSRYFNVMVKIDETMAKCIFLSTPAGVDTVSTSHFALAGGCHLGYQYILSTLNQQKLQ